MILFFFFLVAPSKQALKKILNKSSLNGLLKMK